MDNQNYEAKEIQLAKESCIIDAWNDVWGVKIYPTPDIGRVKFSFIQKGTQGQGFDIYPKLQVMYEWMKDISSGRFERIIASEKAAGEKYPKTYKYITGNSGEKQVGFAPASKGYVVINAKSFIEGENKYTNIPVDYWWIRQLATLLLPYCEGYIKKLQKIVEDSIGEGYYRSFNQNEDVESEGNVEEPAITEKNSSKESPKEPANDYFEIKIKKFSKQDDSMILVDADYVGKPCQLKLPTKNYLADKEKWVALFTAVKEKPVIASLKIKDKVISAIK